jgi:hypothetical protein
MCLKIWGQNSTFAYSSKHRWGSWRHPCGSCQLHTPSSSPFRSLGSNISRHPLTPERRNNVPSIFLEYLKIQSLPVIHTHQCYLLLLSCARQSLLRQCLCAGIYLTVPYCNIQADKMSEKYACLPLSTDSILMNFAATGSSIILLGNCVKRSFIALIYFI